MEKKKKYHSIPTGCSNSYSGVLGGETAKTSVRANTDAAPQPESLQVGQGGPRLASTPSGPPVLFQKLQAFQVVKFQKQKK